MPESASKVSDEFTVLDALSVMAAHWIVLVIIPVVIGVGSYFLSASDNSPAVSSAELLASVGRTTSILEQSEVQSALESLDSTVDAQLIRDGLALAPSNGGRSTRITLSMPAGTNVSAILSEIVDLIDPLVLVEINGERVKGLQESLVSLDRALALYALTLNKLEADAPEALPEDRGFLTDPLGLQVADVLARTLDAGANLISARATVEDTLTRFPKSAVTAAPSAPRKSSPVAVGILAGLGALIALLIIVFIKDGLGRMRRAGRTLTESGAATPKSSS